MGQQFSSNTDKEYSNATSFINTLSQKQRNKNLSNTSTEKKQSKIAQQKKNEKITSQMPNNKVSSQKEQLINHFKKIHSIYQQSIENNSGINANDWLQINQSIAKIEELLSQGNLSVPLNLNRWEKQALERVMSILIMTKPQHIKAIALLNKIGISFEVSNNENFSSEFKIFCNYYYERHQVNIPHTNLQNNSLLNNILSSIVINEQVTLLTNDLDSDSEWRNVGHGIRWVLPIFMILQKADVSLVPEELLQSLEEEYFEELSKFIRTLKDMAPNHRTDFLAGLKVQLLEASKSTREVTKMNNQQYMTFFSCLKEKIKIEENPMQRNLYRNLNKVMKQYFKHDESTLMMNMFFNCENHDLIFKTMESYLKQNNNLPYFSNN